MHTLEPPAVSSISSSARLSSAAASIDSASASSSSNASMGSATSGASVSAPPLRIPVGRHPLAQATWASPGCRWRGQLARGSWNRDWRSYGSVVCARSWPRARSWGSVPGARRRGWLRRKRKADRMPWGLQNQRTSIEPFILKGFMEATADAAKARSGPDVLHGNISGCRKTWCFGSTREPALSADPIERRVVAASRPMDTFALGAADYCDRQDVFPLVDRRGKDTFLSVALGPSPHAPARNDRRPLVGGDAWAVMRTEFAGRFLSPLGAMLTSAAGIVFHQRWVAGVRHVRRCRHHAGPNGPTIGNRRTAAAHRRRARGHRTPASQAPVVRARPRRAAARPQHAVAGSRSVGRLGDVPRVGRGARGRRRVRHRHGRRPPPHDHRQRRHGEGRRILSGHDQEGASCPADRHAEPPAADLPGRFGRRVLAIAGRRFSR